MHLTQLCSTFSFASLSLCYMAIFSTHIRRWRHNVGELYRELHTTDSVAAAAVVVVFPTNILRFRHFVTVRHTVNLAVVDENRLSRHFGALHIANLGAVDENRFVVDPVHRTESLVVVAVVGGIHFVVDLVHRTGSLEYVGRRLLHLSSHHWKVEHRNLNLADVVGHLRLSSLRFGHWVRVVSSRYHCR